MWTIDASVWISAGEPGQANHTMSRAFLRVVRRRGDAMVNPTLLVVEIAAAVVRLRGVVRADRSVRVMRSLPNMTFIALDDASTERACQIAVNQRLRGADAVYAPVAQQYGTTLISLDNEHLTRLASVIPVLRPDEALQSIQS